MIGVLVGAAVDGVVFGAEVWVVTTTWNYLMSGATSFPENWVQGGDLQQ
jgi:hypothetical protein